MRSNKNNHPPRRTYTPNSDGIFIDEPQPDNYLTVITKFYNADGSISVESWHYSWDSIYGFSTEESGWLKIYKHDVRGRDQISLYPTSEIIRVDFNLPSKEYWAAYKNYIENKYGVSYEEFVELNGKSGNLLEANRIKEMIARNFNLPLDSIKIIDFDGDKGDNNE